MLANVHQVGFRHTCAVWNGHWLMCDSKSARLSPLQTDNADEQSNYGKLKQQERKQQVIFRWFSSRRQSWPEARSPLDISVSDVHACALLPARALAAQWSHSSTLQLCSREKIYNINTAVCHKTHQCFYSTCIHHLGVWIYRGRIMVGIWWGSFGCKPAQTTYPRPFIWYFSISWFMLPAWVL